MITYLILHVVVIFIILWWVLKSAKGKYGRIFGAISCLVGFAGFIVVFNIPGMFLFVLVGTSYLLASLAFFVIGIITLIKSNNRQKSLL